MPLARAVQALAATSLIVVRGCLIERRRPGCAPGGAVPFFVSPKKGTKERRPHFACPLRFATGQPAVLGRRAAPQNSLRATRSVQTTAASQSTKRMHAALHAPAPRPALLGTRRGVAKSIRAIASLGPEHAAQSARALWAERSDGPCGFPLPSGRAEKRSGRGARVQRSMHALRELTRRGCLNGAPQARSEFCGGTPTASIAGCPGAQRRGHGKWGRLSLVPFFGETKKGTAPPGAHPGQQRIQQMLEN